MMAAPIRRGDVYPGTGGSTLTGTTPGAELFFRDTVLREGQPGLPVAPSLSPTGMRVGQFSLAEATIGLLVLLGLIWYFDKNVSID